MDDELRRLLRVVAEDDTLPPSAVSDAELIDKCRTAHSPSSHAPSWFSTGTGTLRAVISAVTFVRQRIFARGAGRSDQR